MSGFMEQDPGFSGCATIYGTGQGGEVANAVLVYWLNDDGEHAYQLVKADADWTEHDHEDFSDLHELLKRAAALQIYWETADLIAMMKHVENRTK